MKPNPLQDEPMRRLLREWTVRTPLPPRFQEMVWHRLSQPAPRTRQAGKLWHWLEQWTGLLAARPALGVLCVALFLTTGAALGWAQARQETDRVSGELRLRYVQTINPYQSPP